MKFYLALNMMGRHDRWQLLHIHNFCLIEGQSQKVTYYAGIWKMDLRGVMPFYIILKCSNN